MYIDADEVFADTAEIENFFLTGEYTAYNYGNFVIRNLEENGTYTEFSGPRLMRIFDTTKFIKPIHEYIPIVEPVKYFGAYVNHSGYVGSKGQKKAVRNFEKLHEEYEKNPNDPSVLLQLAFEYTHIDYDKAFEYLKQGIEVCGKNDEKIFEAVFYSVYARLLTEKGHFDKVYSELKDYMKHCDENSAVICTYIDLYAIYGRVCHKLGKNDEALKYFERYFAYYKLFESGELRTEDLMVESPIYVLPLSQKLAMLDYCDTLIALNEYKKAAAVSEQIPPPSEETNELADINRIIIIQKLMIMKLTGNYKPLIELFSDIFEYCKGDEIRDYFLGAVLHGIASANKPLDVIDTAIRAVRSLRTLPKDKLPEDTLPEDYELLLICLHDHYDSVHVSDEDIEKFLGQTEKLSYHCADLIPLMMIEGRSLNIVASRFDPTDYERLFTHFYVYDAVFEKILENYSGTPVFDTLNEDALILLAGCVLCSLENFKNEVESSPDMTSGIYVTLCDRYMQLAYPPEITTEENAEHIIMPIRPGYYLLMAYLHLQNKNAKENLRFLRKALSCRPDLKKYIRHETMMSKVYLI
jgi:tetratricopeptide (TPR) repeat protein